MRRIEQVIKGQGIRKEQSDVRKGQTDENDSFMNDLF